MNVAFRSPLAARAASISVNTTTISSGDAVRVSWAGLGLEPLAPMHVRFYEEAGAEAGVEPEHRWRVEPAGASSLWVGQFSPPVPDAASVYMGTNPQSRGISTEGTPPFTVPAPVKFISGTQLSKGHFDFVVTNMRADVNWVLFSGSLTNASDFSVVAVSPPVALRDASTPMHVRLSRTSSTDQLRVSWTSAQGAGATPVHMVQWGAAAGTLDRAAPASTHTYSAADLCGFPANASGFHSPGFFHEAVLDLASSVPAPLYHYRVGSDSYGWSETRSFSPPAAAQPHGALSVLIAADMGETYEDGSQYHWVEPAAVNTTVHMGRLLAHNGGPGVDLILHPGDLSYATGYEAEWDRWMAQIEPLSSRVPYMTGMGNHERDFPTSGSSIGAGDSGGECGVPTQARFHMPTCEQPNTAPCIGSKFVSRGGAAHSAAVLGAARSRRLGPVGSADDGWWSIEQGPVHVLMVHTEMSSAVGSRQLDFVAADLAAVDRRRTPWVIVLGHRQMYSGNSMGPQNSMGALEPLFVRHKVDIAFWGHIHYAQRSCPMVYAKCVAAKDAAGYDAPIHAVIGNAGQPLTWFPPNETAPWSVYQAGEWGFSHLTAHNATHLTLDYYADAPLDGTAPLHHSVTLVRGYPRA